MKCLNCRNLGESRFSDRKVYRCLKGRYDRGTLQYYALSGITRPNKAVRLIEQACTDFVAREEE
jgi:hypothetical protein